MRARCGAEQVQSGRDKDPVGERRRLPAAVPLGLVYQRPMATHNASAIMYGRASRCRGLVCEMDRP